MKNYFIVGASTGIGQALAQGLAADGHQVYATFNKTEADSTMANLNYFPLNVLDDAYDLDFLPDQLAGFAYCPGSINLKPFARIKPEAFRKDFDLQVVGAIRLLQQILPKLKKNDTPASVLLFSTVAVQLGFPFHAQVATSKGALEGLIHALAAELAPAIRVNGIAPSLTDTPLASKLLNTEEKKTANAQRHPLKKIGSPADIAEMAAFLLSDKAAWMSGQIIHVDGGKSSITS